jgi:HEXXH motif-containing protein
MSITQPRFTDLDVVHINTEAVLRGAHSDGCLVDAAPLLMNRWMFALGNGWRVPRAGDRSSPVVMFADGQAPDVAAVRHLDQGEAGGGCTPQALTVDERALVSARIMAAIDMIDTFHAGYGAVVRDTIAAVVVTCGARAASANSEHGLGTVFVNPGAGWRVLNYAEALLHEGIHNAQYLDQRLTPWCTSPGHGLLDTDAIVSPTRPIPRPLPFLLQAACVGVAIVDLRWWAGQRQAAVQLCEGLVEALRDLQMREVQLSLRGREVLHDLAAAVSASPALVATCVGSRRES